MTTHPRFIQGGMGIGVSGWWLANKVSAAGGLGVISGTGVWLVVARTLQNGDPGGHYRRAFAAFPNQEIVKSVLDRYFLPDGRRGKPYRSIPMMTLKFRGLTQKGVLDIKLEHLMVLSAFAEVYLAKEGHFVPIGVNLLEKIQLMLLPVLYGAMMAGVDYVLIGAGIPIQIPEVLDRLAANQPASYRLNVEEARPEDNFEHYFDPARLCLPTQSLFRPKFLAIVSTDILAKILVTRAKGSIEGFVVEGPTAGGHNAPPRGKGIDPTGQPIYGDKDQPNLANFVSLDRPFWLAGSYAQGLSQARALGAEGIQVGTIFALSRDSGIDQALRARVIAEARVGNLPIRTDARISPSGYPFKCALLERTITDPTQSREPICDIGALRALYRLPHGQLGYRCPAEPIEQFLKKGGKAEDTCGRGCICNALTATIGLGQLRSSGIELPLVTLGDDTSFLADLPEDYGVEEVMPYLLAH